MKIGRYCFRLFLGLSHRHQSRIRKDRVPFSFPTRPRDALSIDSNNINTTRTLWLLFGSLEHVNPPIGGRFASRAVELRMLNFVERKRFKEGFLHQTLTAVLRFLSVLRDSTLKSTSNEGVVSQEGPTPRSPSTRYAVVRGRVTLPLIYVSLPECSSLST